MERTARSVDEYLTSIDGERGEDIRRLDEIIREQMPDAERHLYEGTFWGGSDQLIVGYGILDYRNKSGVDVEWFLVGLAEQKHYISIYVNAVEDGKYLLDQYEGQLGKVKKGSASISFPGLDVVDVAALTEMLGRANTLGA
jgi:hypothetical protein